jgi:hypothetical protein
MRYFKNITVFIVLAWTSFCLSACLKDISGEIPNDQPKVTVNGFFNPKIPFLLTISKSKGILESPVGHYLPDAVGYIYENNVLVDSVKAMPGINYHFSQQSLIPQIGKNYRIELYIPGFDSISAGSILPNTASIQSIQLDTIFYASSGQNVYALRVKFNDYPSFGDYYHLMVYRNRLSESGTWNTEPVCYLSDDLVFDAISKETCSGGFFSDASFNGAEKEILINTKRRLNHKLNDSVQFLVELRHCSPEYYQYNKSLAIFKNGQGDIFSQPGPIIGNVKNGYGIFAGYTGIVDTVKLNE